MSRRKFRENCFKILFCSYFHDEQELYEQVGLFMENEENDYLKAENTENKEADQIDEIYSRAKAVREEMESIDETISLVSRGWTLDRMGKVELTILRLAVFGPRRRSSHGTSLITPTSTRWRSKALKITKAILNA